MPNIGDIGQTIDHQKATWLACPTCGKERWVRDQSRQRHNFTGLCKHCNARNGNIRRGEKNSRWRGGLYIDKTTGYVLVKIYPDDFFWAMAEKTRGYVLEHRLIVAKALGRCLLPWEVVHHKGSKYPLGSLENRQDNRYPENLKLLGGNGSHNTMLDKWCKKLQKENAQLRQRIIELEIFNDSVREVRGIGV